METQDFAQLHTVLSKILSVGTDINAMLKDEAERLHLKLEKELDIRNFMNSVAHNEKYKTILKSVKTLNEKKDRANELGVTLD